jgi:esterase/lipase superfamily enzyme
MLRAGFEGTRGTAMMTRIYFASNRDVKHETSSRGDVFGQRFNAGGPQCFRVGVAEVSLAGGDPRDDDAWTVGATRLYPETLDATPPEEAGAKLGSGKMFEDLREYLRQEDRDVIVYLHGFANSFQNSVARAAALEALYGAGAQKVMVVLFSWPSNGQVQPAWNYFSDREDAEASGLAMGRALKRLVEFLAEMREADQAAVLAARRQGEVPDPVALRQCTRRLHVLAHSMGNWALRHAIRKFIDLNGGRVPRVFDAAFLMAADEDRDALQQPMKLKPLEQLANRVFVYHAANDVALTISDRTKGLPDRLGADGPANLDLASERVVAIDCGQISKTIVAHGRHQYYRLRHEAIADVQLTLDGAAQENRPGREVIRPGRSWRLLPAP